MSIREARPEDHAPIGAVVAAAFVDEPTVPALVEELRAARRMLVELVAVADDTGRAVVGHVALSRGWVDDADRAVPVAVLSPLGVLPARQGEGLGTELVAAALAAAGQRGEAYVFLEGAPGYYGPRGFQRADRHGFVAPSERVPGPAFQVAVLEDRGAAGRLVYADAFWALDAVGLRGEGLRSVREMLGE